jgi:hypothetical protein
MEKNDGEKLKKTAEAKNSLLRPVSVEERYRNYFSAREEE